MVSGPQSAATPVAAAHSFVSSWRLRGSWSEPRDHERHGRHRDFLTAAGRRNGSGIDPRLLRVDHPHIHARMLFGRRHDALTLRIRHRPRPILCLHRVSAHPLPRNLPFCTGAHTTMADQHSERELVRYNERVQIAPCRAQVITSAPILGWRTRRGWRRQGDDQTILRAGASHRGESKSPAHTVTTVVSVRPSAVTMRKVCSPAVIRLAGNATRPAESV